MSVSLTSPDLASCKLPALDETSPPLGPTSRVCTEPAEGTHMSTPTVIVGAGLAGACAALVLSRTRPVVVLEAEAPASGATSAAAGLANP
ncbi:FAD-dependent oxidoreductase, partial [Rubrivirga sp.]|uniref:FAD-dependent oxidoreductase n=1 Tax=Rubrivirga sp. TaxID=1885344 RepID=UPI003C751044